MSLIETANGIVKSKSEVRSALVDLGVPLSTSDLLSAYPSKIKTIDMCKVLNGSNGLTHVISNIPTPFDPGVFILKCVGDNGNGLDKNGNPIKAFFYYNDYLDKDYVYWKCRGTRCEDKQVIERQGKESIKATAECKIDKTGINAHIGNMISQLTSINPDGSKNLTFYGLKWTGYVLPKMAY